MADPDNVDRIIGQWRRERPELDTAAMEVFGRIYLIGKHAGDRMERVYGRYGLSRADFDVLVTLRRAGAPFRLSPQALAAATMITAGGMTGRLDRLERAGLVHRSPDPHDRRGVRVELAGPALALVDRALEDGLADQAARLADLDPKDVERLAEMLRVVLGAVAPPSGPQDRAG